MTVYHETHLNVGIKKDGFLESFCDAPNYRADYTESEVLEKRKKIEQLNELLREAKYSLSPFPEY